MNVVARVLGCGILALLALPVWAATIVVTNGADAGAGSLRDAVDSAQAGDVIEIAAGVTVHLSKDLDIAAGKANVTIQGKNPADGKSGKPSGVGPETAKQRPAPKIVVKAAGVTLRQVILEGAQVAVEAGATGAKVSGCTFTGGASGLTIDGAAAVQVGTDAAGGGGESNTFKGCAVGVSSKNSTGTTIGTNRFDGTGTGVVSENDADLRVTANTISAKAPDNATPGNGVVVAGSSGQIDRNTITPDKKGGTGIIVGAPPAGGPSKGAVKIDGRDLVKVRGKADAIEIKGRSDVTVSQASVEGRTTGDGIRCSIGPDAPDGGTLEIAECSVTGCGRGIVVDCTGSGPQTCTIRDDVVGRCRAAGIECTAGGSAQCTVTGNEVASCGTGMALSCDGGTLACDLNTVTACRRDGVDVRAGGTTVGLGRLDVGGSRGDGVSIASGATATLIDGSFLGNRGSPIFAFDPGAIAVSQAFFDRPFPSTSPLPRVDVRPRGWGELFDGEVTTTRQLQLHDLLTGVEVTVRGPDSFTRQAKVDAHGEVEFDLSLAESGSFTIELTNDSPSGRSCMRDIRFKYKGSAPGGGSGSGLTVAKTKFSFVAVHGQEDFEGVSITNGLDQRQTITVPRLSGAFFIAPSGAVDLEPRQTIQLTIGFSSATVGRFSVKIPIVDGAGKTTTLSASGTAK